jgi:multiple sugar transport system substrate-binding protein
MSLSESHHYFHTEHKAAMFPCPSWYTSRAFVPVDKGGQPKDFQLGFLEYPAMTGGQGTKEKYLDPGGAQTAAAKGKYRDQAIDVINGYTDIDWATDWVSTTGNTTAVKIDPTKVKSDFPDYWASYFKAQDGMTELSNIGIGSVATPGQQDVWYNVVSTGMPQGLISAKDAIQQLDDGWKKNAKQ